MERTDIVKNIDSYVEQAYLIAKDKYFGKNIVRVYYVGGSMFIDVFDNLKLRFTINFNVSNETYSITDFKYKDSIELTGLISIPSLRKLFLIYTLIKGRTDYFYETYKNSCIRYVYNDKMEKFSTTIE